MTSKYEAGFVWHPVERQKFGRFAGAICVIAVSVAIGFAAGRTSILPSRSEPAVPVVEVRTPAAVPAPQPEIARASPSASTAPEEPTPYVVINPGAVNDAPLVEPSNTFSDAKEASKDSSEESKASLVAKRSPPALLSRSRTRSSAKREPTRSKGDETASDYLALREQVLKH